MPDRPPAPAVGTVAAPELLAAPADERHRIVAQIIASGLDHVFTADHVSFHNGNGMDGIVNGSNILPDNTAEISGQVPLRELQSYHSRLKSLSGGEGQFAMDFSHYTPVKAELQKELMKAFRPIEDD